MTATATATATSRPVQRAMVRQGTDRRVRFTLQTAGVGLGRRFSFTGKTVRPGVAPRDLGHLVGELVTPEYDGLPVQCGELRRVAGRQPKPTDAGSSPHR